VVGHTKVVVISLPDAADRRATFAERAHGTPIRWTWFDAHRELAPGLTHDPDEAIVAKGRPMYPGELGCYSSHYAAWEMFLDSGAPQILVLEDDTIVDWGFLEKLVTVDLQAAGIPYLRLYAKRPCAFREVLRDAIEQQRTLIEYLDRPLGTQGYVMTREGAQRFVRHCRVVKRPVDDELDRSWEHGVACLGIFPSPVIEQSTASTIGPARFEGFTIPGRLRVRRQAMKMRDRGLKLRQRLRLLMSGRSPTLRSLAAR
jgi:glycosyl transferase family 25